MSEIYQTIAQEGPQAYQSMIFEYKVAQCPSIKEGTQCPNGASCLGYHSTSDRRRRVFDEVTYHLRYDYHLCPILTSQSHCPDGDLCRYAHNKYEINFHPFIYKLYKCENPLCHQDPKIQACCPGCHSTSEKAPQKIFNHAKMFLQRQDHDDLRSPAIRPHRVQLDLTTFKTEPCEIKTSHNFKECIYYHSNKKDRRRDLTKIRYYPEPCINGGPNGCDNEYCMFAHNKTEEFYHPLKFKTKYCKYLIHDINRCDYGQYCSFAHADGEIAIDLIHCKNKDNAFFVYDYKTVFCPFVYEHTRSDCVYAHNPQDFRRDPIDEPNIIPEQCEHWTRDDRIIAYEMGGCPRGLKCNKCHGWKEYEFHPQIFKTRLCSNGTNCHKDACPFFHNPDDKRDPFNMIPPPSDRRIGRKRIGYLPFTSPKGFVPSPVNKRMAHYNNTNSGNKSPLLAGPQSPTLNGMSPGIPANPPISSFSAAFKPIKLQGFQPQMLSPQQSYEERKITSDKKPPGALKPRSEYGEARSPSDLTGNIWNSYNSTYMNQEFSEDGDRPRSLNENMMMNGMKGSHPGGNGFYIKTKFAPHELGGGGGGFDGGFSMLGHGGYGSPNYLPEHGPISFGGQQAYQGSPSRQGNIQSFMNSSPSKKFSKPAPQQQVESKASTNADKEFADIQKILDDQ